MTEVARVIKFGNFELDNDSQLLYKDGEELALEPKLVEVLQYLLDHRDRYVPLSELHEQVWAGRIVSDTAVRRTISKLRQALDDDVNEPMYIKSLPKRGYRVIADINNLETAQAAATKPTPDSIVTTSSNDASVVALEPQIAPQIKGEDAEIDIQALGSKDAHESLTTQFVAPDSSERSTSDDSIAKNGTSIFRSKGFLVCCALLAMVAVTSGGIFALKAVAPGVEVVSGEGSVIVKSITTIPSLPGQKLSLAVSEDGQFMAYSGRRSSNEPYNLYVQNMATGDIKRLTDGGNGLVRDVSFLSGGHAVAYTAIQDNQVSLIVSRLDKDAREQAHVIKGGYYNAGGIAVDPKSSNLFIPAFDNSEVAIIQEVDINTGAAREVSYSDSSGSLDYLVALSPDGSKYAYVRDNKQYNNNFIYIFDFETDELLNKVSWPDFALDLSWLDEDRLLVLDEKYLSLISKDGPSTNRVLTNDYSRYRKIDVVDPATILLLKAENKDFIEVSFNRQDFSIEKKLPLPEYAVFSAPHFDANKRFLVMVETLGWSLNEYNTVTKHVDKLFESRSVISVYDHNERNRSLLLKLRGRVAIYYLATNEVQYITNRTQIVPSARFDLNGRSVIFGEQHITGWRLRRYQIDTGDTTDLAPGYRSIRPHEDGESYLAERESGDIVWLDSSLNLKQGVGVKTDLKAHRQWDYSNGQIVWLERLDDLFLFKSLTLPNQSQAEFSTGPYTLFSGLYAITPNRLNYTMSTRIPFGGIV